MGTNVTHRKIIQELASFLYRNPETANNEFKACKKQVEILESMGFQVTVPYSSIPTSFRAEYKSPFAKNDCKTICFLSEYDALENMGHACGHHLIASAAFAGFLASVNLCETEKLNAKILLLGTPAEEGYGGKVQLLNAGAFENIDYCLTTHPYYNTYLDSGTMAASRYKIKFLGKSSHAGNAPQDGVNALDSMITFFSSIGLYRQQMQKGNMVHGIITNGGTLPNIIPELTEAYFYLRSTANDKIEKLAKDFKRMLSCSASMHGCKFDIKQHGYPYAVSKTNPMLEKFAKTAFQSVLWDPIIAPEKISSDYSNVSLKLPTLSFFFGISKEKQKIALHSKEFLKAGAKPYALDQAIKAGQVMSKIFLQAVQAE